MMEGNRISGAHRQSHLWDGSESPGRSENEHVCGPESAIFPEVEPATVRVKTA